MYTKAATTNTRNTEMCINHILIISHMARLFNYIYTFISLNISAISLQQTVHVMCSVKAFSTTTT